MVAAELNVPDLVGALRGLVEQIPPGKVSTYRAVAEALGDPEVAVFVARWLGSPEAEGWPVHRVVHASGTVGRAWGRTPEEAAQALRAEGVRVIGLKVEPLVRYFFADFRTERPLARLRAEQDEIARRVVLKELGFVERLGAVDVAYQGEEAVAAFVLATADGRELDYALARAQAKFPYVSGYLSYRELPAYLAVLAEAERLGLRADVILVDGNGILHPRRAGVASHLGVLTGQATVGVAKGHLCGHVNTEGMAIGEWRPVVLGEETVGGALRTDRHTTLFVSPGHQADVMGSIQLVQELTRERPHPAPLALAHELASEAARG